MAYTQTGIRETREKKMSKVTPKKSKLETGYKIDLWLCNFGLLRICAHWHWRTKVKWNDVKISYFFFGRHRRRWRCFRRGRWYFVTLVSRRLKAQNDCDIYTFWVTIAIKRCEFPNDYYIYVIDIEFHASRGNNEASNMKCRRYKCQYTHSIWFVCRCLLLIFFFSLLLVFSRAVLSCTTHEAQNNRLWLSFFFGFFIQPKSLDSLKNANTKKKHTKCVGVMFWL